MQAGKLYEWLNEPNKRQRTGDDMVTNIRMQGIQQRLRMELGGKKSKAIAPGRDDKDWVGKALEKDAEEQKEKEEDEIPDWEVAAFEKGMMENDSVVGDSEPE